MPDGTSRTGGAADHPDAVVETDPVTIEHVAFGARSLEDAEQSGALRIEGDRRLVERFFQLFPVPGGPEPAPQA